MDEPRNMLAFLLKDSNLLAAAIALACLVVLIAIALFKRKIGNLLDRLWPRPESEPTPVTQQKTESNSFGVTPNIVPDSKHAIALAVRIISDMEKSPISSEERLRLVSVLAANHILRAEFEGKYRGIFKSQMEALAGLRQRGPHSLDPYYQAFLARVEERKDEVTAIGLQTSFEAWISFLTSLNSPYVEIDGGIARITERGDAFMEFTIRAGPTSHIL